MTPEPANAESVPPATTTSEPVKSLEDSLSLNVIVAVVPAFKAALLEVIAMVGRTASTASGTFNEPATLATPLRSVKLPAATVIVAGPLKPASGVNVAVYCMPAPAKFESVPPVTATADAVKVVDGLLSVNVIVAVSAARTAVLLVAITTVGGTVATIASKRSTTAAWSMPKIMANELVSLAPGASVPMPTARLIAASATAPLGSTGVCRTSAGLLMKKPSGEATARGSAEPSAIAPPAAAPTTSRPLRSTSLEVAKLPLGSGSTFSSRATPVSVATVPLVMVVVTTA